MMTHANLPEEEQLTAIQVDGLTVIDDDGWSCLTGQTDRQTPMMSSPSSCSQDGGIVNSVMMIGLQSSSGSLPP